MNIKYGTLSTYVYYMTNHEHNSRPGHIYEIQRKIRLHGALDPADPQTRDIIGPDLFDSATQNGILFYPSDAYFVHNTIHTDNVYKILPHDPCFAAIFEDYMVEKIIVNYEYFLNKTNPTPRVRRALICVIADAMNFKSATDPYFVKQLSTDRPFIERWFEKIR